MDYVRGPLEFYGSLELSLDISDCPRLVSFAKRFGNYNYHTVTLLVNLGPSTCQSTPTIPFLEAHSSPQCVNSQRFRWNLDAYLVPFQKFLVRSFVKNVAHASLHTTFCFPYHRWVRVIACWCNPYRIVLDSSWFSSLQRIFGQGLFVYRNVS